MKLPLPDTFTPETLAEHWKSHGVTVNMILGYIDEGTLKAFIPGSIPYAMRNFNSQISGILKMVNNPFHRRVGIEKEHHNSILIAKEEVLKFEAEYSKTSTATPSPAATETIDEHQSPETELQLCERLIQQGCNEKAILQKLVHDFPTITAHMIGTLLKPSAPGEIVEHGAIRKRGRDLLKKHGVGKSAKSPQ